VSDEKPMGQVIQIDEARTRDHLGEMVRGTVEETLNAMLDAEADQLCGAGRYERSEARQGPRGEPYAQGYPCPGEPGRGRSEGASDRRRPARRQDEHGGRSGRAERVRDPDLLLLVGIGR
jgi:hypothetical protein